MTMTKYELLRKYLKSKAKITLTYAEIENILGFKLPDSAYTHKVWWSNHPSHTQALAWLEAGWNVQHVELGESVTFIRSDS